jgi:hypothetical protein
MCGSIGSLLCPIHVVGPTLDYNKFVSWLIFSCLCKFNSSIMVTPVYHTDLNISEMHSVNQMQLMALKITLLKY